MNINKAVKTIFSFLFCTLCVLCPAFGQDTGTGVSQVEGKVKRAWEIGIGGSIFGFNRIDFTNFQRMNDQYEFDVQLRHNVIGPNLYIARELTPNFYLDMQGTVGFTEQYIDGKDRLRTLYMIGPGLQWRLGEYFDSKYIDPFFRVGVSYMKKNFDIKYSGTEGNLPDEMNWVLQNIYNKSGADRSELFPIAAGVGLNTWLNDNFGIGLQGDYLFMPHKDVANSMQGTVRLIWRIGGKSKRKPPVVEYVEKIVQAPPITIEKIVEVPAEAKEMPPVEVCELFENIYFEFDKSDIRPESHDTLDKIADILKSSKPRKYLITGYTDARGSSEYNIGLSQRRAASVIQALEERGVDPDMLKSRGVGKKISYAPTSASNEIREGDRKVSVEIITNMYYWDFMPKNDLK